LKEVRGSALFSNVPVIMLTALDDELTQLSSFNGLADDYVTKPFSPRILVKRVEALLRRSGEYADGEILKAGPLLVHSGNYEAYESGARIDLTVKELELLKAFLASPRKVFTRQALLDLVWGYDYFGDERVVDAHIKNLRKKLKGSFIATVKGIGYKLDPACLNDRGSI
jgi:DNA-binding response OmpR family regulator